MADSSPIDKSLAVQPHQPISLQWGDFYKRISAELDQFNILAFAVDDRYGAQLPFLATCRIDGAVKAFTCKLEKDWREFLRVNTEHGHPAKGDQKRMANKLATMIVEKRGPAKFLLLLLSPEFKVSANLKDSKKITLLEKAFAAEISWNIHVLLTGFKQNQAKVDDYGRHDSPLPAFHRENWFDKPGCILTAVSMDRGGNAMHFDTITKKEVDSTTSIVKSLLDRGAHMYCHDIAERDKDGRSVWSHVAERKCHISVMQLLLQSVPVEEHVLHMNERHTLVEREVRNPRQMFTPLGFVKKSGFPENRVTCSLNCTRRHCDIPKIKLFIDNGANPHMCGEYQVMENNRYVVRQVKLELCAGSWAQLGLAMFERVVRHRCLVTLSLQRARKKSDEKILLNTDWPPEVLRLICKMAGIGKQRMSDPTTPWIPTLPKRIKDPSPHDPEEVENQLEVNDPALRHAYDLVDTLRASRVKTAA
jgi:hypothetical protein